MDDETRDQIKKLEAELYTIGDQLGPLYRRRDEVLERLAELRPPYELPRPSRRTPTQEKVARCPRCSGLLVSDQREG